MAFQIERTGETAWIRADGDLDLANAPTFERTLRSLETDEGVKRLVLDLRSVRFLDSTGLRVVLAADARLRPTDRRFEIVRGPRAVQRVFQLAMLDERLDFLDEGAHSADAQTDEGGP